MCGFGGVDNLHQGKAPKVPRKGCRAAAAQCGKTIWLYEDWWKATSLRNPNGIRPEKGHGSRIDDGLSDAFMQTKEGNLLHEVSTYSLGFPSAANQFY